MSKIEYGEMPCRECGKTVKMLMAENGTLSYRCLARGCDDSDYAKAGSLKNESWLKRIQKFSDAPVNVQPIAQSGAINAPEPEKSTNIWGL